MLKVLKSGFFTTVQDSGRFNLRNKGVPVSGAMDSISVSKVNMLLENPPDAAVLEVTMTGPTLEFEEDTYICLGGADISITLNNVPIHNYQIYKISQGDIISYGKLEKGLRCYLAVKNGFKTPVILGSRSFYVPITPTNCIGDKSLIPYETHTFFEPKIEGLKIGSLLDETVLEMHKGPEHDKLTNEQMEALFMQDFTIAKENNRMAYQLNESIETHRISMLTSATLPGTVQLTPAGKLIILMKDAQTTGGYPRIGQLSEKSISILAQKKFGDRISFKLV
ncbi:MAG: biotin-dependent carboxyltransferase family protein [Bacteroidota bacterium]